jgi:hypothetical protein
MIESADQRYLDSIERHYFFELERRDRIHSSLRVLISLILAVLGAAWLLATGAAPDSGAAAGGFHTVSIVLCGFSIIFACLSLNEAVPIATEDHYESVLHQNFISDIQRLLNRTVNEESESSEFRDVRLKALSRYLFTNYERALLNNVALNEEFIKRRRDATYWLFASAVLIIFAGLTRYGAGRL